MAVHLHQSQSSNSSLCPCVHTSVLYVCVSAPNLHISSSVQLFLCHIELKIWPSNSIAGHIPRGNHNWKWLTYPNVHHRTICSGQDLEATWMSFDRWIDKEAVVHIHNGLLLSHKKECPWLNYKEGDEPRAYFTEWSQEEKEKYHILTNIYGI